MKVRKNLLSLILLLVLLVTTISSCGMLPSEEEDLQPPLVVPEEVSYKTQKVETGHIERLLKGTATLRSIDEISYYFNIDNAVFKEIYVSSGDEVEAGDILAEIESGDLDTQIAQMEITMQKQELNMDFLDYRYSNAYGSSERKSIQLEIDLLELDMESTEISYNDLMERKRETQLIAEEAGIVTFVAGGFEPGDTVPSYKTMVTVADPTKLQLYYESVNAKEAQIGMDVTYKYGGETLTGKVLQTPNDVSADNEQYKNSLFMSCDNIPENLVWGDQLDFTIVVAQTDDALIVPRSAISEYSGKYYVDVLNGESKYTVEVTLGNHWLHRCSDYQRIG